MAFYSIYLIILWAILIAVKPTRRFTLAMSPWFLFACSYDWMRILPNYEVNPIDIRGIFETELNLFGISTAAGKVIPGQYFSTHNAPLADLLAGFFYLCWVPVPLAYSIYMYVKGKRQESARFSIAFLLVNLFGFALYYVHPAAPPWYALEYGFEPIYNTPGNVAGFARFDALMPFPIFSHIYAGNANVFAAVPSLHSAYVLAAAIYTVINRNSKKLTMCFCIITTGIWCSAVYTCHHYVIDVLLGIAETLVVVAVLEFALRKISFVRSIYDRYVSLL